MPGFYHPRQPMTTPHVILRKVRNIKPEHMLPERPAGLTFRATLRTQPQIATIAALIDHSARLAEGRPSTSFVEAPDAAIDAAMCAVRSLSPTAVAAARHMLHAWLQAHFNEFLQGIQAAALDEEKLKAEINSFADAITRRYLAHLTGTKGAAAVEADSLRRI
jgi:hypothetical protein